MAMENFKVLRSLVVLLLLVQPSHHAMAFDYFKLMQQWPVTFCNTVRSCKASPLPPYFTIHGLWPENFSGPAPRSCANNATFNSGNNSTLEQRLHTSWPDLKNAQDMKFWVYQWEKHGSCSQTLNNQPAYWKLAVNLKAMVDLVGCLHRMNIIPSSQKLYRLQSIKAAIVSCAGKLPTLRCFKKGGQTQLWEVGICFDRAGAKMDCPHTRTRTRTRTACGQAAANISFPL